MNTSRRHDQAADGTASAPRRVFLFVNGIHVLPGDAEGWTDRAVTWTHIHTDARGEKFEYATTFATRLIRQQARAEKFARMIGYYAKSHHGGTEGTEWEINLVGHSNGCEIILRTLRFLQKETKGTKIGSIHLIAAACEADFWRNGLNELLADGLLGRACVYVGGKDRALKIAKATEPVLRMFGAGYGSLGLTGPINPLFVRAGCIETIVEPEFDHSTWFEKGERFDRTMGMVTSQTDRTSRTELQKEWRGAADHTAELRRPGSCTVVPRTQNANA